MTKPLPELLAPAGSMDALRAAIAGGADAVYFGGGAFNARLRAQNFTDDDVREAITLCHAHGVKAYMTFNTLITDRELPDFLAAVRTAYQCGADALIVADLGAADLLRQALPDLPLHASTQCSAHSTAGVKALEARGFCRVVPARELPREEIARLVRECDAEIEVFIHGALCVSHSGQCLFSSLVGGRSGNRGVCAQPCRLPDAKGNYPLSLKDLCLAREIPFFIQTGVRSLKIEGRLKSPDYVYRVVSVYRRLLDERRAATDIEVAELAAIFSRSGFTDAYFQKNIGHHMMGIRSEDDKEKARQLPAAALELPPIPLALSFEMCKEKPIRLTLSDTKRTVTVAGDVPLSAQNAPMDAERVKKNLCRFGGTPYTLGTADVTVEDGLMLPVSKLNALRREALRALTETGRNMPQTELPTPKRARGTRLTARSARFERAEQITQAALAYFDCRYLPLHAFDERVANGVTLPPVIFDSEVGFVRNALKKAAEQGAKHALLGNVGHLTLALEAGLVPHGDFRLNLCNEQALAAALAQGFADALLSPELTLPQIRDIGGACDCIVYGRIPLMLLEKCAGREAGDCARCADGKNHLTDRRGEKFPIFRIEGANGSHRNSLCNSRPTVMSDRQADLRSAKIAAGHYIFTVESPAEVDAVIRAYQNGTPLFDKVRRI